MKKLILTSASLFFAVFVFAQTPVGTWKTIDDETGKAKSHVEIYKAKDGMLQAKVLKILTPGEENANCNECKGDKKDKPITGMVILTGMSEKSGTWKGGTILDPKNGKEYKCTMKLKDANTLDVRGFVGVSLLGRTQTWYRLK